jgi:hypothetical protein
MANTCILRVLRHVQGSCGSALVLSVDTLNVEIRGTVGILGGESEIRN